MPTPSLGTWHADVELILFDPRGTEDGRGDQPGPRRWCVDVMGGIDAWPCSADALGCPHVRECVGGDEDDCARQGGTRAKMCCGAPWLERITPSLAQKRAQGEGSADMDNEQCPLVAGRLCPHQPTGFGNTR